MSKIKMIQAKWKERIKKAPSELRRADGIGSVEMILILTVLIILMIVFRSQIVGLVQWIARKMMKL